MVLSFLDNRWLKFLQMTLVIFHGLNQAARSLSSSGNGLEIWGCIHTSPTFELL